MGIYVFRTKFLMDELRRDAANPSSSRDFGKDIIPHIVQHGKAVAHRFGESCVRETPGHEAYWRDVGTVDAYWQANIDLTDVLPDLIFQPVLADLDLCRNQAASKVRPQRGWPPRHGAVVAGIGRLHHFRRIAASKPDLHWRSCPLLFLAARGGHPARMRDRPPCAARPACEPQHNRAGLVVGDDPELDASRFRRTESGICLITQSMLDKAGLVYE